MEAFNSRYMSAKKVAVLGMALNIALLVLKLVTGYMYKSQAMIADGFNSLGDVSASLIAFCGSVVAARPKDADHNFGHGKAEFLASLFIGVFMAGMAAYSVRGSVTALIRHSQPDVTAWLIGVAVLTIVAKSVMYLYAEKKAKEYDSLLIRACAIDHRNDIFITTGTLTAILLARAGYYWSDGIIGLIIAAWIAYSGVKIIVEASRTLMDESINPKKAEEYKKAALGVEGVERIDKMEDAPTGPKYVLVIKISVDKNITVEAGHHIGKQVEKTLLEEFSELDEVIVHVNPV